VGTGEDLKISELASLIARESGFDGEIRWDSSKPDGTPRKLLDISRIKALGWANKLTLEMGVKETIDWFRVNESRVRA
jgi:GDP-L-fucose synthase